MKGGKRSFPDGGGRGKLCRFTGFVDFQLNGTQILTYLFHLSEYAVKAPTDTHLHAFSEQLAQVLE